MECNTNHIILLYCYRQVDCRSLFDWGGSLGSCKPQIIIIWSIFQVVRMQVDSSTDTGCIHALHCSSSLCQILHTNTSSCSFGTGCRTSLVCAERLCEPSSWGLCWDKWHSYIKCFDSIFWNILHAFSHIWNMGKLNIFSRYFMLFITFKIVEYKKLFLTC